MKEAAQELQAASGERATAEAQLAAAKKVGDTIAAAKALALEEERYQNAVAGIRRLKAEGDS